MYSRKGLRKGRTHLQSAYEAMRSHRPTKKNPLPGTQKGYKNRFTTCLLVPNVVEKKKNCLLFENVEHISKSVYDFVARRTPSERLKTDIRFVEIRHSIKIHAEDFNKNLDSGYAGNKLASISM